jgi:hypothetical protein
LDDWVIYDPYGYRQQVLEGGEAFGDGAEDNPQPALVERIGNVNAVEREQSRIRASQTIGESGQVLSTEKLQATTQVLESVNDLAKQAVAAPSTQDAIKAIAAQNSMTAALLAQLRLEQLESRADQQLGNLSAAAASETLDYLRQQQMWEERAHAALLQRQAETSILF